MAALKSSNKGDGITCPGVVQAMGPIAATKLCVTRNKAISLVLLNQFSGGLI